MVIAKRNGGKIQVDVVIFSVKDVAISVNLSSEEKLGLMHVLITVKLLKEQEDPSQNGHHTSGDPEFEGSLL